MDLLRKKPSRIDLNGELDPVKELRQEMKTALESVSASRRELSNAKRTKLQQINDEFDALTAILVQERKHFIHCTEKSFEEQGSLFSSKQSEILEAMRKLDLAVQSLNTTSPTTSKSANDKRKNAMKVVETFRKPSLDPMASSEMEVELCSPTDFQEFLHAKNFQYRKLDSLKCHTERGLDLSNVTVRESFDVSLFLSLQGLKKGGKIDLTAQLCSCHDQSSQNLCVRRITNEKYSLSFAARKQGKHELHIKCNDIHVCGSPMPLYATVPPSQLKRLSSKKLANDASGMTWYGGTVYACAKVIEVLDPASLSIDLSIRVPDIYAIVLQKPHIYATDMKEHRLIKMDMNGTVTASTGTLGNDPGQFDFPRGISLSKSNMLYVCDSNNHRIQVFDKNLNFIRCLGSKGSTNGCFNNPTDLELDDTGKLYVADEKNGRIQVLTPQGQHIRSIPSSHPVSVAIHMGMVYSTDWESHRVLVFKLTGEFVASFGEGTLFHPKGIAIDENGFVYVSDSRSTVVKF